MLSNLINEAQTPSKKNKAGLNENSIKDQNLPLWKCNLDAFLNNPGITYIIRFHEIILVTKIPSIVPEIDSMN